MHTYAAHAIMGNNKLNARTAHEVTRTHTHAYALVFGPKLYRGIGYNDLRIEQGLDRRNTEPKKTISSSPAIRVLDCFIH